LADLKKARELEELQYFKLIERLKVPLRNWIASAKVREYCDQV